MRRHLEEASWLKLALTLIGLVSAAIASGMLAASCELHIEPRDLGAALGAFGLWGAGG